MPTVTIFENQIVGKMTPPHAVNNGPVYKFTSDPGITNLKAFNEESAEAKEVELALCDSDQARTAEIYLLDKDHDMKPVKTEIVNRKVVLKMSLFSTALVNVK